MHVDLDKLRPDIREFIVGQLKPNEMLATNASRAVQTVKENGRLRLRSRRLRFGETSAEEIALMLQRDPEYKSVRLVQYPSHILPGSSAVIVEPR